MSRFANLERRQVLLDAVVALVVFVLGLISPVGIEGSGLPDVFSREADWFHTVLVLSMGAPLTFRRIYPTTVFFVVLGAWVVDRALDYPDSLATVGVLVVFYTIGTELSRRRSFVMGGSRPSLCCCGRLLER